MNYTHDFLHGIERQTFARLFRNVSFGLPELRFAVFPLDPPACTTGTVDAYTYLAGVITTT